MPIRLMAAAAAILATVVAAGAQERHVTMAATTSIQDSGLLNHLLPRLYAQTGITVRVLSRPSTQSVITAEKGEVDLVIVNDSALLDRLAQRASGLRRHKLMYNDFVLVGPVADPAGVKPTRDAASALREIARTRSVFISRGDGSGTHAAEQRLWRAAQVNPKARSGNWFQELGLGMAPTLHQAAKQNGYALVDRATWLAEGDGSSHTIVSQGDPMLFNQYEVVLMANTPPDRQMNASIVLDWLLSPEGQDAIGSLRANGVRLFSPNRTGGTS